MSLIVYRSFRLLFRCLVSFFLHRIIFLLCAVSRTGKPEAKVRLQPVRVVLCLLFAFNKWGESTRRVCLLPPAVPGQQKRGPARREEGTGCFLGVLEQSREGLSGPGPCPFCEGSPPCRLGAGCRRLGGVLATATPPRPGHTQINGF